MKNKKEIVLISAGLVLLCSVSIYYAVTFYKSTFRLSQAEISESLLKRPSSCTKLSDCALQPGDILVRRYINSNTIYFDKLLHLYFTHSAFYLGDGNIVEAIGPQKDHQNEIQVTKLSESDWMDSGIESWVVIRPTYSASQLESIEANLENIADDPEYRFGLPSLGERNVTCSGLIASELINGGAITGNNISHNPTPDFLFSLTMTDNNRFKVFAYPIEFFSPLF
jgi:hypothetical protein